MTTDRDSEAKPDTPRRASRPHDAIGVRFRILNAAKALFAERGYAHVSVREITAKAGADVSMVTRYFGSKEALFEIAVAEAIHPTELWSRPRESFGRSVVADFFDERETTLAPLKMLVRTAADPSVRDVTHRLFDRHVLRPLAEWLGDPDGEERATQILTLFAGLFMYKIMIPLPAYSEIDSTASRRWIEAAIQEIVDRTERLPISAD